MLPVALLLLLVALPAYAQQSPPDWESLALRGEEAATMHQMVANAMISQLQHEVADLKAQLKKAQDTPPPQSNAEPAK